MNLKKSMLKTLMRGKAQNNAIGINEIYPHMKLFSISHKLIMLIAQYSYYSLITFNVILHNYTAI